MFNPGPTEPRYALPLQTVKIQISCLEAAGSSKLID